MARMMPTKNSRRLRREVLSAMRQTLTEAGVAIGELSVVAGEGGLSTSLNEFDLDLPKRTAVTSGTREMHVLRL